MINVNDSINYIWTTRLQNILRQQNNLLRNKSIMSCDI
jgi:hypothetical protein